jgi:hypothetical protein
MGQFSFECSECGEHEQFDWTDQVVVGVKNARTGEVRHVLGRYGSYGDVYIDLCNEKPSEYDAAGALNVAALAEPNGSMPVYHKQFEDCFSCWSHHSHEHVAAEEIYCFGNFCRTETRPKQRGKRARDTRRDGPEEISDNERGRRRERSEDEDEEEESEEEEEEVQVRGERKCVPRSRGIVVLGALPRAFAADLPKYTPGGYVPLGDEALEQMVGPPGGGGMDPGCVVM